MILMQNEWNRIELNLPTPDHSAPVNMVATNLAFIQANQEFYQELADSRWHPITSYTATLDEVCQ